MLHRVRRLATTAARATGKTTLISIASCSLLLYFAPYNSSFGDYSKSTTYKTMATATKVVLKPELGAQFAVGKLTQEAADRTSELLQKNHEKHHIFFNAEGFHSMF